MLKHAALAAAVAAAFVSVPVFAQSSVTSGTGGSVSTGTGGTVQPAMPAPAAQPTVPSTAATPATPATPATAATPATPATPATSGTAATPATPATPATAATPATPAQPRASVTVTPSTSTMAKPAPRMLPGGTMIQHGSTTVLGGPSGAASGTKTEVTTYWANVPANAQSNAAFQRWQRLK